LTKTKPRRKAARRDDPEQSRLFIDKAREVGADEEQSAADELLGQLHKKPPAPRKQSAKNKR
jgi:hypothetical protein